RSAPKVFVRAVRRTVVNGDRYPPLLRVCDLFFPSHAPFPCWRDDRQVGGQRGGAQVEPHLVVPFPRATVGNERGSLALGDRDKAAVLQPPNRNGGVQSSGIGQNHFVPRHGRSCPNHSIDATLVSAYLNVLTSWCHSCTKLSNIGHVV